ncbi:hypothetical protein QVG61_03150 [Thiohalobacter sp. IOR34]|uniref:hypothetical protein n=1 Tax=Thiohalobacter sp. IOR34 TaxID=3057176 RepID=UPI0025B24A0F|nr:hypothetical protein [Thiohalobacter sp. IOR34]WJW76104.1 hypothetical protein QVG61_03150 [Thiohalobacter sp. IOR34]
MDEDEYRAAYRAVNANRCIFEKAINSRRASCSRMRRFCLADREGVGCEAGEGRQRCTEFLERMRDSARFALQLTQVGGPLPHNREIRVQLGGLLGLQALVGAAGDSVRDVAATLSGAIERYGRLADLPYSELVKDVARFRGRQRRRPRRGH